MSTEIRLDWYVKQQHTKTFTQAEFDEWVSHALPDVESPASLDAVYEALDDRDWRAVEALDVLATPATWLECSDVEVIDLTEHEAAS